MNRAADNWLPLVAVAELAGGSWPALAEAAIGAESSQPAETTPTGIQCLADLLSIFDKEGADELPTKQLLTALAGLEERPWAQWGKTGKPITDNALGRLLKPFAIRSKTIRVGDATPKGYQREPISEAWARYGFPDFDPQHRHNVEIIDEIGKTNPQHDPNVAGSKSEKAEQNQACGGVAARKPEIPGEGGVSPLERWQRDQSADDELLNQERKP